MRVASTTPEATPIGSGTRTVPQAGSIVMLIEAVTAFGMWNPTPRQYGVTVALGTAVASWLMRLFERRFGVAWLRDVPDR